jgi:hypothetical protein
MPSSQFPILETLEDRLVFSGLTDGSPVLKKISFIDADGDQVTVQVSGKVPKGAGFQISGAENGSNIEEINLVGLGPKSDLSITVKPVRAADSDRTTSNAIFTPGYTMVGKITADSQTDNLNRSVEGALTMRHLRLSAAVVSAIDISETDILGSVSLNTGRTAFVDRINTAAVQIPGVDVSYNPSAGLVDLYDVTAKSIRGIQVDGVVAALANRASGLPSDNTPTNDLLGAITVTGDLGGITARHGVMSGDVNVGGNLGLSAFGKFTGTLSVLGDATVRLPANADAVLAVVGHLHLGWQPPQPPAAVLGEGGGPAFSNANVFAGGGISGLRASLVDPILVPSAYNGTLTNTSTSADAGKAVAGILVTGSNPAMFQVVSSNSIGDLRALSFGTDMKVDAGTGGIGAITSSAGGIGGTYSSAGNIGAISATGGAITGEFEATGNVGQITVKTPNTDGLTGTVKAGGLITGIDVTISTLAGKEAINSTNISAGTTIGPIKVSTLSASAIAVGGEIKAASGITSIEITAATTAAALGSTAKINADSDGNGTGDLPIITVINNGTGPAVNGAEIKGATVGAVTFNARNGNSNATTGVTVEARNAITTVQALGNLTGDTKFTTTADTSTIGPITGTGTGNQVVKASTGSFGTIGAVTFNQLVAQSVVTYEIAANVSSIGNISARGSADSSVVLTGALTGLNSLAAIRADGTADLRNLKSGVNSLGAINVGTLVLPSNLASVSNLGSLNAVQVNTTGAVTFGASFGTAGAITIANSSTGGTGQRVTFGFLNYSQNPLIAGTSLFVGQTRGSFTRP